MYYTFLPKTGGNWRIRDREVAGWKRGEVFFGGADRGDEGEGEWRREGQGFDEEKVGDRRLLGLEEW